MGRKELFVGNLSRDVQKRDIEDVFDRYGKLIRCDVKDKGIYLFLFKLELRI
jgi:RNA recognition motif-containing protein